jgi:hypothetical protein
MRKLAQLLLVLISTVIFSACNPFQAKSNAGLQVITGDIPSSLFLDGQYLEKTPYIGKDIKPGQYTLRIEPDDAALIPYETTITLRSGLLSVVAWRPGTRPELSGGVMYELEKLSNKKATEVSVITIPDGAFVSIQGREKEFAPLTTTTIEPGEQEFEVTLPSYETQKHTINIVAGHRTTITVKLAKSEAIVTSDTSQPTATPSATTTPGQSEPLSTRQASAAAQKTASGSATLTGSRVRIKSTGFFINGQEVLRVRDSASAGGEELGLAPVGSEYRYSGQSLAGWYQITFNGQTGWVSSQYAELLN